VFPGPRVGGGELGGRRRAGADKKGHGYRYGGLVGESWRGYFPWGDAIHQWRVYRDGGRLDCAIYRAVMGNLLGAPRPVVTAVVGASGEEVQENMIGDLQKKLRMVEERERQAAERDDDDLLL